MLALLATAVHHFRPQLLVGPRPDRVGVGPVYAETVIQVLRILLLKDEISDLGRGPRLFVVAAQGVRDRRAPLATDHERLALAVAFERDFGLRFLIVLVE